MGPLCELGVLRDGLVALLLATAIGDLVAEAGAHAELLGDVLDGEEGAGDLAEAGVVVEDRGHAVTKRVEDRGVGGGTGTVQREVVVDLPPLLLEVLEEVGGIAALDGEAAGETGVDVRVAVDEARHDDATVGVNVLVARVSGLELLLVADGGDGVSADGNRAALEVGVLGVASNDTTIADDQHSAPSNGQAGFVTCDSLMEARPDSG